MVAKIEMTDPTSLLSAVIRVYPSRNTWQEVGVGPILPNLSLPDRMNGEKIAARLTRDLQNKLDTRQLISTLPDDDPDKTHDPARPDLFWDNNILVGREGVVTVTWDGTQYHIEWSRA